MLIYKTTNLINGKIYIGQELMDKSDYFGSGHLIKLAIKKYGKNSFNKEILEICSSIEQLNDREKYWISFYNSTNKEIGYNISKGGQAGKLLEVESKKGLSYDEYYGIEKSRSIKKKMSQKRLGKPHIYKNISKEDVYQKISNSLLNRTLNDEIKLKISDSVKEYYNTEKGINQRIKQSLEKSNTKLSEETKQKIKKSMAGKCPTKLEIHPSAKIWKFYDNNNELIFSGLGNKKEILLQLNINERNIVKFDCIEECFEYILPSNKKYKVYGEKYYKIN